MFSMTIHSALHCPSETGSVMVKCNINHQHCKHPKPIYISMSICLTYINSSGRSMHTWAKLVLVVKKIFDIRIKKNIGCFWCRKKTVGLPVMQSSNAHEFGWMYWFNVNYHNLYYCIYSQLCDSGVKLFASCVAGHIRSVQHTIIISFTRLGLVRPKKLCWQAAGWALGDFLTLLIAILVRPPVTRKYFYYC